MKEYFTDDDLEYIKITQKNFCKNTREEWNKYKNMVDKPFSYWYYFFLSKSMTMNEIIKRGRQPLYRWWGRLKLDKRSIDIIRNSYNHWEFNWAIKIAKWLWISVYTVYKYSKKYDKNWRRN